MEQRMIVIQETKGKPSISVHYGEQIIHLVEGKNLVAIRKEEVPLDTDKVFEAYNQMTNALTKIEMDLIGLDML